MRTFPEDLANRIMKHLNDYQNFDQFCDLLKTKEVTYSRISRALLHIILGINSSFINQTASEGMIHYARMLGFRKDQEILSLIKNKASVPLISRLSDMDSLSDFGRQMLHLDIFFFQPV